MNALILGKWTLTQTGYDANNNGKIDSGEVFNYTGGTKTETYNSNGKMFDTGYYGGPGVFQQYQYGFVSNNSYFTGKITWVYDKSHFFYPIAPIRRGGRGMLTIWLALAEITRREHIIFAIFWLKPWDFNFNPVRRGGSGQLNVHFFKSAICHTPNHLIPAALSEIYIHIV